jgi:hypothetical protein
MLPRLALNSWLQVIHLPQLGLQAYAIITLCSAISSSYPRNVLVTRTLIISSSFQAGS